MKPKNKLSIFALQQRSSRPAATVVLIIFSLVYIIYLIILLVINMQKGWSAMQNTIPEKVTAYNGFELYEAEVDRSFREVYI